MKMKCIYVNKARSPVPGLPRALDTPLSSLFLGSWGSNFGPPYFIPVPRSAPHPSFPPECLVTFSSFPFLLLAFIEP